MSRRSKSKEEWLHDINALQRNIVFPDTVQNEGRFWRNIYEGKQPLNLVHWVGISPIFVFFGASVFFYAWTLSQDYKGPWWQRLFRGFGPEIIVTAGVVLLLLSAITSFGTRTEKAEPHRHPISANSYSFEI